MGFRKAERKKAKLRLGLCAPSGGGKTLSALLIAQGLGGEIAMIDTENGSGDLYSDRCDYDICPIGPPFSPQKYVAAIKEAEAAGYNVLIIDSLSHAWAGEGGILSEVDRRKGSGNQFAAWRDVTPMHNNLVNAILQANMHIIVTMRTKTAYDMVKDEKSGKIKPVKIGLAPVQRDGMEYEFTAVFDIRQEDHMATTSKDRTSIFDGQYFIPSIETGKQFLTWLEAGDSEWEPPKAADPAPQSQANTARQSATINQGMVIYKNIAKMFKLGAPDTTPDGIKADTYQFISETVGREVGNQEDLKALSPDEIENIKKAFKSFSNSKKTGTAA